MRVYAIVVMLLAVGGPATAAEPFRIALVPTRSHEAERFISAAAKDPDTFFVVLTNVSQEAEPVWETGNSWGYRTISFELTLPDRTAHVVSKKRQVFTRNGPGTFFVSPASDQVYPIQFNSAWDGLPVFSAAGEIRMMVKAIYEVEPSKEAEKHHVWVGRVVSPNYTLTLRHW